VGSEVGDGSLVGGTDGVDDGVTEGVGDAVADVVGVGLDVGTGVAVAVGSLVGTTSKVGWPDGLGSAPGPRVPVGGRYAGPARMPEKPGPAAR
jgi:hypothetical protein